VVGADDADAKAAVTAFLDEIGYDTVDAGPLAEGWRFQRDTAAYAGLYFGPGGRGGDAGEPVDAPTLKSRLAAARRYADTADTADTAAG